MNIENFKKARKVLEKLDYVNYENSHKSPYICDNLDDHNDKQYFKEVFSELGSGSLGSVQVLLLNKIIRMNEVSKEEYNQVQLVRLIMLDLIIEMLDKC